ncbi:C4-dicarboxylate ABC transporter [Roseovarius faecimaris]|uniref:C4-dicarboxylate ABC transporter n=1 Tax=Roseovarius faecimaris TaxID=2494550 RepID=A0A6I6J3M7_9RHOB|nr:SLAC1 anion channel family protein [Roseovarius faecimaris]QGX99388.1 C4-dicarboxylate ABC transporter [Roseovarius faecimaris]
MSANTPSRILVAWPVAFFTIVMGLAGFTLALRAVEAQLGMTALLSTGAFMLTALVFAVVALGYLVKLLRHREAVLAEWNHPVKLAFFPAMSISMLLIAAIVLPYSQGAASVIWLVAVALQLVLTISVISGWISHRAFQHGHLTPAWFIPVVGNVIAPIAGAPLGFVELSTFFMAAGLIFWVSLLSLVMNRLIFHDPLPERLMPTLVILIAPPAIGFVGWTQLVGGVDLFARLLLNVAFLFALIVAVQLPRILRVPFSLSFWALSFPVAALSTASLLYGGAMGSPVHSGIGLGVFAVLCVILGMLILRTIAAIRSGAAFEA